MQNSNREAPVYGTGTETMNIQTQLEEEEDEGIGRGGEESIDNPNAGYEDGTGTGVGVEDVTGSAMFIAGGSDYNSVTGNGSDADQLTLSFQGEVYVFDGVSPDKVQAVLLLLGGYEIPSAIPAAVPVPLNQRGMNNFSGRSLQNHRAASLNRFREKRKERCFEKKIRYNVRKEVALRMMRKKGQFTSSKTTTDEGGCGVGSGQDEGMLETLCTHCGISSKSTPMMRRGPAGPRTLCNACGLKWANKGVLRDISRGSSMAIQDPSAKANGEFNVSDSAIVSTDGISSSTGDSTVVTAETISQ
uniref:Uncharacterized protein MANES_07G041300 n=1 Tax=Rhizophora mucronata TaxID=61149 RepID=A0A2P2KGT6_RHIMU